MILGLPPSPDSVDFDEAGPGTCLIWHLSFEDGLVGAEVGLNANDLEGCFDLSDSIEVIRNQPEGGFLMGSVNYIFCVGNGEPDFVDSLSLSGNVGDSSAWLITNEVGLILSLPSNPVDFDFNKTGPGTALIWHLSYFGDLTGVQTGMNVNNIQGCFALSNPLSVFRLQPIGGTISGGPFEFCVGDGETDNVSGITLFGNVGPNSAWVVTDEDGLILALPPTPEVVDFDGAGPGTCFIWHLSFENGLVGAEVGMNANDLQGCFSLSNAITVTKVEDGPLCVISVEEINPQNISFELWPNPAQTELSIALQLEQQPVEIFVEIRSSLGELVKVREFVPAEQLNESLNIGDLPQGVYWISIRTERIMSTRKLLKK